jgi:carbonic anhydrase
MWNADYADYEASAGKSEGRLIISSLWRVGAPSPELQKVVDGVVAMGADNETVIQEALSPRGFLPLSLEAFADYQAGSSTPPCDLSLHLVLLSPMECSLEQLRALEEGTDLSRLYRPLQVHTRHSKSIFHDQMQIAIKNCSQPSKCIL